MQNTQEKEKEFFGLNTTEWMAVAKATSTAAIAAYTTAKTIKKSKR